MNGGLKTGKFSPCIAAALATPKTNQRAYLIDHENCCEITSLHFSEMLRLQVVDMCIENI